jgi:hypothetical protein
MGVGAGKKRDKISGRLKESGRQIFACIEIRWIKIEKLM